ncbi:glycosyltransferase family 4 protein [Ottowia sp. GY511]|nr:glycosyltransferase family 4 protein [Ottowia sp. GY511]
MIVQRVRFGPGQWPRADIFAHFDFVSNASPLAVRGSAELGSLLWVIPDFSIGSGGHLNIFRTIFHLESMGYQSTILIVGPTVHLDAVSARRDIADHFFPLKADVVIEGGDLPAAEFAVATGWQTAYFVRRFPSSLKKIYFAQDFEPYFYPMGSEYIFAENTYHFGFFGIAAGDWLAERLERDYGMKTRAVGFGVEHDRYRPLPRREPHIKRVFFYARPPTPRRAFELGLLVLDAVHRALPSVEFVLAGWNTADYRIPFPHLDCGTVGLDELPDLYAQCDVALVLSLTNLSLLPLELMGCGCAVVSNTGANVEWLLSEEIAVLTEPTPEALSRAVCELLENDERRMALIARAEAFAKTQHWSNVAVAFEAGLQSARETSLCAA